jgi:hypothetical protein
MSLDEKLVEVVILPRRRLRGDGGAVHLPGDVVALPEAEADAVVARRTARYALSEETVRVVRSMVARGRTRLAPTTEADFAALDLDDRDLSDPEAVAKRASRRRPTRKTTTTPKTRTRR